jgi:hypothetical protein
MIFVSSSQSIFMCDIMSRLIDQILNEVCLDERIQDGIFDMSNNSHMDALRESMSDKFGISLNDCTSLHNKMLEGKYPERQAYNKDGLLVTFPTPQHKSRAIQRGTHFEQNPAKGQSNVFGAGGQQPPAGGQQPAPAAPKQPSAEPPAEPKDPAPNVFDKEPAPAPATGQSTPSSLPPSDSPTPTSPPSGGDAPSSGGSSLPASGAQPPPATPGQPPLAVEPAAPATPGQPGNPAPPPNFDTPKSPEQRAAEAQVVKQMLSGGDNNPSSPTMPLNVSEQITNVYNFAKQMGYHSAMTFIAEAMQKK